MLAVEALPTLPAVRPERDPGSLDDLDVIGLDDVDCVRAWFEEIVIAEWPPTPAAPNITPPGAKASPVRAGDPGPVAPPANYAVVGPPARVPHPRVARLGRERSPPNTRPHPITADRSRSSNPGGGALA